jgi:hypothetical protein
VRSVLEWLSTSWPIVVATMIALAAAIAAWGSWRQNKKAADAAEDSARSAQASAEAARRSAEMAEGTYRLEQQRQHDQRTPRLTAEYLLTGTHHDLHAVRLEHHGPVDLDRVEVTIEASTGERQAFHMFDTPGGRTWSIACLRVGDRPDVGIDRPDRFGGRVRLSCRCVVGDEEWTVPVIVDFKPRPAPATAPAATHEGRL